MDKALCQICGRPFGARAGLISHHGYRRPRGQGFHTQSTCDGARQLPYEVSRDVLKLHVDGLRAEVVSLSIWVAELRADAPGLMLHIQRVEHTQADAWGRREIKAIHRASFTAATIEQSVRDEREAWRGCYARTWAEQRSRALSIAERKLGAANAEEQRQTERLIAPLADGARSPFEEFADE